MNKKNMHTVLVVMMILTAAAITGIVFKTAFAKFTIDAWSFAASLFLVIEAAYKMKTINEKFWPNQFLRLIRIIIGTCIFTIHTFQVIYGV